MPVLLVMNMPTPLLKSTYSDIADTSIKTAGSEGNPFYDIHWLAKEKRRHRKPNRKSYPYNKHGPFSSPKALVPTKPP